VRSDGSRAKQPASSPLSGPYGRPYHPALVTVPIGAWTASLIFDIASRLVSKPAFLTAGSRWLIGIGIAGAIAASLAGFLDIASITEGTKAYRTACTHMLINILLICAYAANLVWRERTPARVAFVGTGMLALSAACFALLAVSGLLGGKLTHRYGVRVAGDVTKEPGHRAGRHDTQPESGYR
jgi:uncharacterized membrane protein